MLGIMADQACAVNVREPFVKKILLIYYSYVTATKKVLFAIIVNSRNAWKTLELSSIEFSVV